MKNNDILKVQLIVQLYLYDQSTSPLRFNKVNDGTGEVNKVAALQILQYCEERHMSRTEADDYLKSQHKLIEVVTGRPFNMVKSFKTLKRVFLDTMDRKLPLSSCNIHLPQRFFDKCRTESNNPLPSLKAHYIPLEYVIGLLLLKMSPDDIIHNMKAEFWSGLDRDGAESVQRIYTNWSSSKYAVDIQRLIRDRIDTALIPLILFFSIFIDKGVMNQGQTRSATPVSISLQNIKGTCCQSLIGFVPDHSGTSTEVLDALLAEQGVNKTSRKYILQHTSRQREWDYLQSTITPFLDRQEAENGFDVQIGTGINKKFYRVFVVFTNFNADSPQMHSLTGVSNSACHLCMCKNFSNFRINDSDANGRHGTIAEVSRPRKIINQFNAGLRHLDAMSAFINKEEGSNTRQAQKIRASVVKELTKLNGYSGCNKVFSIFKYLIHGGNIITHSEMNDADCFFCVPFLTCVLVSLFFF